jgi:hypothetical protein
LQQVPFKYIVLCDTVSGPPETAPIAPPLCRPPPPAWCRYAPAPSGMAPHLRPASGLVPTLAAFTAPRLLPSIYKTPLPSTRRRTFSSLLHTLSTLLAPFSVSAPPSPAQWLLARCTAPFISPEMPLCPIIQDQNN